MLVMKRPRLSTCRIGSSPSSPFATRTLPLEQAGLDARVGERLGQGRRRRAPGPGPGRRPPAAGSDARCSARASLVDGRQREVLREVHGGGAGVHPRQLEGGEREREVLGPLDGSAVLGLEAGGGQARAVELLRAAPASRRSTRASPAPRRPRGAPPAPARRARTALHECLEVEPVGEPPHHLPRLVAGQRLQGMNRSRSCALHL